MATSGALIFYTERVPQDLARALKGCFALLHADAAMVAFVREEQSRGWDAAMRLQREGLPPISRGGPYETHLRMVKGPMSLVQAHDLIRLHSVVALEMRSGVVENQLYDAIGQAIDVSVRGDFLRHQPQITIGWHDLVGEDARGRPLLIARPYFELSLWSRGVARDAQGFLREVSRVEPVKRIRSDLEAVVGPVEQIVLWST